MPAFVSRSILILFAAVFGGSAAFPVAGIAEPIRIGMLFSLSGPFADTANEQRNGAMLAVEDYVETCARVGKEPQKTYSGQVMFRVSPEVHRKAAIAAELAGKSLNQWAEEVLDHAAE